MQNNEINDAKSLQERERICALVLAGQAQASQGLLIAGNTVFAKLEAKAEEIQKKARQ